MISNKTPGFLEMRFSRQDVDSIRVALERLDRGSFEKVITKIRDSQIVDMEIILAFCNTIGKSYERRGETYSDSKALQNTEAIASYLIFTAEVIAANAKADFERICKLAEIYKGAQAKTVFQQVWNLANKMRKHGLDRKWEDSTIEKVCDLLEKYKEGGVKGIAEQIGSE